MKLGRAGPRGFVISVFMLFMLSGCATISLPRDNEPMGYDYTNVLINRSNFSLERMADSIISLRTVAEFKKGNGEIVKRESFGSGIAVLDKYIITLHHVAFIKALEYNTPFGVLTEPAEKVSENLVLIINGKEWPLQRAIISEKEDVAIFLLPHGVSVPQFPQRIGNSDDLRMGNFIYLIGNPMNGGINVREGIVSGLKPPEALKDVAQLENIFMVSNGLNPGDSGTPIIALRDGSPEIVGLAQGTVMNSQRIGWAIKINVIKKLIREYENKK
ncbi:MAG: serine protease [Candidatus Sungiibacteriota bacterium]|uniref:Serine protease n=1 Tax=Candidatus Sungiibacteriota bacterium TaxID=2750080 RepID=A0A7T5UQA7_9BACT|nr:MAG: serine protease [Candidatus Sungbacteria bacterium]